MGAYQELVSSVVHPLLGRMYNSPEHLDSEIISVFQQLIQASHRTLPTLSHPKKQKWFKDQDLSHLAALKKSAWDKWCSCGRPQEGPLYEEKIRTRAKFRKRLNICAASVERARVQKIDNKFHQRLSDRFKLSKFTNHRSTLRISGFVTSDTATVLHA